MSPLTHNKKVRAFILSHSATSLIKWMGSQGWSLSKAEKIVKNLASAPVARTSIITALNDGRSEKYKANAAQLVQSEIDQLEAAYLADSSSSFMPEVAEAAELNAMKARVSELEKEVKALAERTPVKTEIVIKQLDKPSVTLTEHVHPIFEQVMFHLSCGDNVMLVGPSGCGKTHLAEQIAKALGREHAALSLSGGVTESKIFGRVVPNVTSGKSEFHGTPFTELYEKGGVVLLDEVDAADPNVLLSLNLALGNRRLLLDRAKNPIVKQHTDFVCLAAANTWGNGADRQYVGRNQQDSAFNARFAPLSMDYDTALEFALCPGAAELVKRMHTYRANARVNKLERFISTRFICRAFNWLQHGKDMNYIDTMLFDGWRADEVRKCRGQV